MVTNDQVLEALGNVEYQKIMGAASRSYTSVLSSDELESCKMVAMWKALEGFDSTRNVKFTSYLYRGVMFECKSQAKMVRKCRAVAQYHSNLTAKSQGFNQELMEELNHVDNGNILYEYYINGTTISQLAEKLGCSKQNITAKKSSALRKLRLRLA